MQEPNHLFRGQIGQTNDASLKEDRPKADDGSFMGFNLIDYYSDWTAAYPLKSRATQEIVKGMKDFEGPLTGPRVRQLTKLTFERRGVH